MLLNLFETNFRKNKIRRRGFIYKKPCPIRKRRRKFRILKIKSISRIFNKSYRIRYMKRRMWKFRQLKRYKRNTSLKIWKTRKLLRSVYGSESLPSRDILFSYWVNKPVLRTMTHNHIWLFIKKLIFLNQTFAFVLKGLSPKYCDPSLLFWQYSYSKFQLLLDVYRPFYYNTLNYSTFNSLNTHESFFSSSKKKLFTLQSDWTDNTFSKKPDVTSNGLRRKWTTLRLLIKKNLFKPTRSYKTLNPQTVRIGPQTRVAATSTSAIPKQRPNLVKPSTLLTQKCSKTTGNLTRLDRRSRIFKHYVVKRNLQAVMGRNLIKARKTRVFSYFLKLHDYLTHYVLRIKEKDALYNIQGFRQNFKQQYCRIKGLNHLWLVSTMDSYFESTVDYNWNCLNKSHQKFKPRFKKNRLNSYRQLLFSQKKAKFTLKNLAAEQITLDNNTRQLISKNNLTFHNLLQNTKLLHNTDLTASILANKVIYKYLSFNYRDFKAWSTSRNNHLALRSFSNDFAQTHFNSRVTAYSNSNILPSQHFNYSIRRKLFKLFKFHKFSINVTMWYYNMLIRFMENCSGKKVYLKFNPFVENSLGFSDIARCNMWAIRVASFQRILGPKIFVQESLHIFHVAIRFKDPTFLSNWIKGMLQRMSFWKYRLLFRYFKFVMRYLFFAHFADLGFKGLKLRLKGKISVAGNARTRTLRYAIGETSYSTFNNKVVSDFSTINTFTGVLGFRIWFFF